MVSSILDNIEFRKLDVYFHCPFDHDWSRASYLNIGTLENTNDLWTYAHATKSNTHKGMFFICRDGIFPSWDTDENLNGGCVSLKCLMDEVHDFFIDMLVKFASNSIIIKNEWVDDNTKINNVKVNLISVSPKKNFCIIKIWLNCIDVEESNLQLPNGYTGKCVIRKHR